MQFVIVYFSYILYLSRFAFSVRSPVFSRMFSSGMLESTQNVVKIDDFSDDIVKGMLDYIYTGQTGSLPENASELLRIADKYQLLGLKEDCERVIEKNLTIENAAEILALAHIHSANKLKTRVMVFIERYVHPYS